MTIVAITVLAILTVLLSAGVVCVITRAGSAEGICKYTNNDEEDNK